MASQFPNVNVMNDFAYDEYMVADTTFRDILNEQSGGAFVVEVRPQDERAGDFFTTNFYGAEIDKARLEAPNVQTATTARQFKQVKQIDIRTGAVFDQYEWQSVASEWINQPPEAMARLFGRTVAESFNRKMQEAAVSSLIACMSTGIAGTPDSVVAELIHDIGGATTPDATKRLDMDQLTQARLRFGDRYEEATVVLMHTGAYAGMTSRNLSEYKELFTFGNNVQRRTSEGLPIYLSDLPILTFRQGTATKYRTLILKRRSVVIYDNDNFRMLFDTSTGQTWIQDTAQAQMFFNIKPMGFTWANTSNVHPKLGTTNDSGKRLGLHTDTGVLDNVASWKRVGVDEGRALTKKELPAVMIISQ